MSEPSRDHFVKEVIDHVKVKFPLVKISRAEMPFSVKVNGRIEELENLFRMALLRPGDRLHHIDRWIVELLRCAEGTPDRTGGFAEVKDRIMPVVLPVNAADAYRGAVTEPLVGDLMVAYAIDQDRTISYIPADRFKDWDISLDDLHTLALDNLVERSQSLAAHAAEDEDGEVNLILFQTLDGYDASRILLPTLHEKLRGFLGSPFCAAIPNRDLLICFKDDPETVDRLHRQVQQDFRQMPHQVSDRLLLVTADGLAARD